VILDGGLATELEARGHDISDELWSARLLVDEPASIQQLHLDYLRAGADCIVSASYQASIPGFVRRGSSEQQAVRMLRRSVELARAARDEFWATPESRSGRHRPLVAASVGPYGAFLADGSEYTGDYDLDAEGLAGFHRRRLMILASCGADLLACETIPSLLEARVLVDLLEEIPASRAWLSFSCRDEARISDGTLLATVIERIAASPSVIAVGVNCTAPRFVGSLITAARGATSKPLVAYPNSGEMYDAEAKGWLQGESEPRSAGTAAQWAENGARIIGGCCRTGPAEIRSLRAQLLG
jgi:homocysteine S-methyltransferase